jgi:hypothetical protein
MRHRESTGIAAAAVGVKYLAQTLDELLYDYSPASFKPRVMGLESLCGEALVLTDQIESGQIDRSRIESVLDELEVVLQSDPVANELIEFPSKYYVSFLKESKPQDLRVRLNLLNNKIDDGQYIRALQRKLIQLCIDDKQKKLIYQTARRWVSALNTAGYSKQHVRSVVNEVFFSSVIVVSANDELTRLFNKFSFQPVEYDVAFIASSIVTQASGVAEKFNAFIHNWDEAIVQPLIELGASADAGKRIICFKKIRVLDAYSARLFAEKRLEHISDLLALFHHKNKIIWDPVAFISTKNSEWSRVEPQNSSLKRSKDNVPVKAGEKLDTIFTRLKFSDHDSINRFVSIVRLHGSALEAVSSEAQLVNIWTAMEVLVHREFESKLKGVVRLLTPFLIYSYVDSLLHHLAGDIYRWRKNKFYKILKIDELKGWRTHHRLAAILRGGQFEQRRQDLYELIAPFQLLRFRCFHISEMISSCASLESALQDHERRVVWQIRRIYRCRNLIVHDGTSPDFLDSLTENAHEYLDTFIDRFFVLCAKFGSATSLEEAAMFQSQLYEQWRKKLREGADISPDMVREMCALTL